MGLTEFERAWAVQLGGDHGPVEAWDRAVYRMAVAGTVAVPAYRVVTDQDGQFQVVPREPATAMDRAVLDGDVRRRLQLGVFGNASGVDPFADVRHGAFVGRWPEYADQQERAFVCPECRVVSSHPDDVANRYCGRCHRFTGDPEDPTAGSPLARAVAEVEEWTWGAGTPVDDVHGEVTEDGRLVNTVTDVFEVAEYVGGVIESRYRLDGVRPHLPESDEEAEARRRIAEFGYRPHRLQVPDGLAGHGQVEQQPVIPGETS